MGPPTRAEEGKSKAPARALLANYGFENEFAMPQMRRSNRWAALLGAIVILAGCDSIPIFRGQPDQASKANQSPAKVHGPPAVHQVEQPDRHAKLNAASVKRLQASLANLGFKPGPVDGIVGPKTVGAVKAYQEANRLPATGEITARFRKHLEATVAQRDATISETLGKLSPKDLPTYRAGTTFVYSNGNVERVSRTEGSVTSWIQNDRVNFTARANFLLPWAFWVSKTERGTVRVSDTADRLWPLNEGDEVAFSAQVIVERRDDRSLTTRRIDHWRCINDGGRNVDVMLGSFDAVTLVCRRDAAPGRPALVRTWYYVKRFGHYVRFVERGAKRNQTTIVDLLAIQPGAANWPPIVRAGLTRTIANALETAEVGSRIPWSSSAVKTKVVIEPRDRFVSPEGRSCRQIVQVWSKNGHDRIYPAVACKTPLGRWEIPGIESGAATSLVASREKL